LVPEPTTDASKPLKKPAQQKTNNRRMPLLVGMVDPLTGATTWREAEDSDEDESLAASQYGDMLHDIPRNTAFVLF
jgi:hypothetical protein